MNVSPVTATIGLMLWLELAGCSDAPESAAHKLPDAPSEVSTATPVAVATSTVDGLRSGRFDKALLPEMEHMNPAHDGWDSEVASSIMLDQLKEFATWLAKPEDDFDPSWIADDFSGSTPMPTETSDLFIQAPFTIKRVNKNGALPLDKGDWLAAWRGKPQATVHFKAVHVSLSGQQVKFTALFDSVTKANDGMKVQENAVWVTQWQWIEPETAVLKRLETKAHEIVTVEAKPLFQDATESVLGGNASFSQQLAHGIDAWRERIDWRFGMEITGPHGLAIGDVNDDGLDDLYVCESGGLPNKLFVQQANGTALDVSESAGIDFIEPTHSALFVDLDNDGDQDLAITAGRHVFVYQNDGQARFTQRAATQSNSMARSIAAADYDADGDLDLYVCGYYDRSGDTVGLGRPMPYHDANNGVENHLLANHGNWQFNDVTDEVGLGVNNHRYSYAAVWEDYDNDGDLDLYVANDFGRNNLYRNEQGRFTDVAAAAGVEDLSAGMSVSWGDYNLDGHLDLYVGNMFSSAGNRIAYQRRYRQNATASLKQNLRRHARGNTLFQNTGDGSFRDVTLSAGVNMGRWAWSSNFVDLNNDGFEDLMIANGMVTAPEDTDDL